jgi:hypothetical protein
MKLKLKYYAAVAVACALDCASTVADYLGDAICNAIANGCDALDDMAEDAYSRANAAGEEFHWNSIKQHNEVAESWNYGFASDAQLAGAQKRMSDALVYLSEVHG